MASRGARLAFLAHAFFCEDCVPRNTHTDEWKVCGVGDKLKAWTYREDPAEDTKPLDFQIKEA